MFDKKGLSGELIEKGQGAVKSTKKGLSDFGEEALGQLSGSGSGLDNKDQGTNEQGSQNQAQNQQMSDEEAKDFLQDLYGAKNSSQPSAISPQPSDKQKPGNSGSAKQAVGISLSDPNKGKTPEEIAKINVLKDKLHKEKYYDPTFNPTREEVESVQDEQEREEQVKKMEAIEEKKELKNVDLGPAVKQGTGERHPGVSG